MRNKPVTEGQILHGSTHMRYLNVRLMETVKWWLSGAEERGQWGEAVQWASSLSEARGSSSRDAQHGAY